MLVDRHDVFTESRIGGREGGRGRGGGEVPGIFFSLRFPCLGLFTILEGHPRLSEEAQGEVWG